MSTGKREQIEKTSAQPEAGTRDPLAAIRRLYFPAHDADRQTLLSRLQDETQAQSAWTVFYHEAIADRLKLNVTDHKCLNLIVKGSLLDHGNLTPGELAKLTRLTTGAVTGVLDRLESAGFVKREHDPEDRRRVIIRPTMDRIQRDVAPIFEWLSRAYEQECSEYTEEELHLLIGFARRCQGLLQEATRQLRELPEELPAGDE